MFLLQKFGFSGAVSLMVSSSTARVTKEWLQEITTLLNFITKITLTCRLLAVHVENTVRKFVTVDVSSGSYVCSMPNLIEKD